MAVLEKIRKRASLLVGIIALALFSFVIQGLFSPGNSIFGGRNNSVGEINGNTIQGEEFQKILTDMEERYKKNQNTPVDDNVREQLMNQVWNDYLDKFLFDEQMDQVGVGVSEDELRDMIQGENIDPQVKNIPIFQDSVTKKFDVKLVKKFLETQLSEENDPDGEYRRSWDEFQASLKKQKIKNKYNNLIRKAVYVTTAQAKVDFSNKNLNASYRLLVKPFDSVSDSSIKVSDEDLKKYYDEHNYEFYQNDETRSIEYTVFQVNPTRQDREDLLKNFEKLKAEFETTKDDSSFVNANSNEGFRDNFVKRGQLSPQIDSVIFSSGKEGGVYGPFFEGDQVKLVKFRGTSNKPDSVRARHILFSTGQGLDAKKARAKADSLKTILEKDTAGFAAYAAKLSDDPGSKGKGGDLGWFSEGMMVQPFNDACFNGQPGDFVVVETQFGAHIINITGKTNSSVKARVAYLIRDMEASSSTTGKIYSDANEFAVNAQDYESFKKVSKSKNILVNKFENLKASDRNINDLAGCKEIVQWVYQADREVNEVSKVFSLDKKYVVVAYTGKKDKGIPTFDQLKKTLEPLAKKDKKAEMFAADLKKAMSGTSSIDQIALKVKLKADTTSMIAFSSFNLEKHGFEPKIVGAIFGVKKGTLSQPIKGNKGVFLIQVENFENKAATPKSWKEQKNESAMQLRGRTDGAIYNAILKKGNIEDKRYLFF